MIEIYEISVLLAVEATLCGGAADLYMHTEINPSLNWAVPQEVDNSVPE